MIVGKAIKPQRLKQDAMRLALLTGLHNAGREAVKEYQKTVSTWSHKPSFGYEISLAGPGPILVVGISGGSGEAAKIWQYVNEGTPAHVILPKHAKALAFPSAYSAKTAPGVIQARAGGASGDTVFAKGVMHPGTDARDFDEAIKTAYEPKFKRRMEQAMREARVKSGHAIQK